MTPVFSIVMPAYNNGATIGAAVDSVLRQTREDFELIIVDDGSTDDTVERLEPYLGDARIKLFRQRNAGPSAARNAGITAASSGLVSFLDSDDLWLPHYLEVMGETLATHPEAAAAFTDAWVLHDEVNRIARATAMQGWWPTPFPTKPDDFLNALLEHGNFVYNSVTAWRSAILEVGGYRETLRSSVDYELWLRMAARGHRFVRARGNLAVYRHREAGQITSDPAKIISERREVFRLVAEEYDVPDQTRELARKELRTHERLLAERSATRRRRSYRLANALYRPIWLLRWFYVRPPKDVRNAFPVLRDI